MVLIQQSYRSHELTLHLFILACVLSLTGCAASSRHYTCHRAPAGIEVDGKLSDRAWSAAPWTSDLINVVGPDHPAPPYRTRCKILWTDTHLYVAAELADRDIRAAMTKHGDLLFKENCFELFIDPDGDGRDYWEIEINALGTIWDLRVSRPYRDGGKAIKGATLKNLRTAVHVNGTLNNSSDRDQSWTLEMAIPFADIEATPHPGDTWRLNFTRIHYTNKKPHFSSWSAIGEENYHRPDRFGRVRFSK